MSSSRSFPSLWDGLCRIKRDYQQTESVSSSKGNKSAILLPASYFLDPDLNVFVFKNNSDRSVDTKLQNVSYPVKVMWDYKLWVLSTVFLVARLFRGLGSSGVVKESYYSFIAWLDMGKIRSCLSSSKVVEYHILTKV